MVIKHFLVYFIKKDHWSQYPVLGPHGVITLSYWWSYLAYIWFGYYRISFPKVLYSGLAAALLWKRQYFSTKRKHCCLLSLLKVLKPSKIRRAVYKDVTNMLSHIANCINRIVLECWLPLNTQTSWAHLTAQCSYVKKDGCICQSSSISLTSKKMYSTQT